MKLALLKSSEKAVVFRASLVRKLRAQYEAGDSRE